MLVSQNKPKRITVTEYGKPISISFQANELNISPSQLRLFLNTAADKINTSLGIKDAIIFGDNTFQVNKIAGIIRLSPSIDLEIIPKFLDGTDVPWREDFFLISTLTEYGRIFPNDSLASSANKDANLTDLLAKIVIDLYDRNFRKPLRIYKLKHWKSLDIDGDLDPESTILSEPEGFYQSSLILDRQNKYNNVIFQSMLQLVAEVRDNDIRKQLLKRVNHLSPQCNERISFETRLPTRHMHWQDLYDLSKQILKGLNVGYGNYGIGYLPGYLIRTANVWQDLLLIGLRAGLKERQVSSRLHTFGSQIKIGSKLKILSVAPDITIERTGRCILIVDAKYKTINQGQEGKESISRSDIYEVLTFLNSSACKRALIIYPSSKPLSSTCIPGSLGAFELVKIRDYEIFGLNLDTRGIAKSGGFKAFCSNFATNIKAWECL